MVTVEKLAAMTGKSTHYIKEQVGVFVIGNGFDRSIGREITYEKFFKSRYWPRRRELDCPLKKYLHDTHRESEWFDLEIALGNYADAENNLIRNIERDSIFYQKLVEEMFLYASPKRIKTLKLIKKNKGKQVKDVPLAYHVLETILLQPLYHFYN